MNSKKIPKGWNKERFLEEFMFQLTKEEYEFLRSQIVTLKNDRKD